MSFIAIIMIPSMILRQKLREEYKFLLLQIFILKSSRGFSLRMSLKTLYRINFNFAIAPYVDESQARFGKRAKTTEFLTHRCNIPLRMGIIVRKLFAFKRREQQELVL